MKKDKAVRKAEIKSAIIKQLKSLAVPAVLLLVILIGVLVVIFYKPAAEEEELIEVHSYTGDGSMVVMENEHLLFEMDGSTTQFTVTDKDSGTVWYSNPVDAKDDPIAIADQKERLQSTLLLEYSSQTGYGLTFNNFKYSVEKGIYEIEQGTDDRGDFIKVLYTVGETEKVFAIPEVISETRFNELFDGVEIDVRNRATNYYKKYDLNNLGRKDDPDELLAMYPILAQEPAYTLRPGSSDNVKGMLQTIFESLGYTYEDSLEDKAEGEGEAASSKPLFNINVIYRLEGERMSVEVPLEEIEFRKKYPVYNLTLLPYFGCGGQQDEGYMMVPEGGGALIYFNSGKASQQNYAANMYGWDKASPPTENGRAFIVNETEAYFNAFGITRNGSSFLCIMEEGAPYATILADIGGPGKLNSYNYVNAKYTLLHRETYEMGSRYNTQLYLFQQTLPQESIRMSYCFMDSDDYVDMAKAYRQYLLEKYGGLLAERKDSSTPMVIEILGAVDKVEQVLGVPVSRPLELTTYKEAQAILEQLNADGVKNMSVKFSGWMNGGVQQKILKKVKLISDLGNKKSLNSLTSYAASNGIDLYLDGITNYAYDSNILDGFFSYTDAAKFTSKERAVIYPYNTVSFVERDSQDPYYLLKGSLIDDMVNNFVKAVDKYNANVSFKDIGSDLNSDYNRKAVVSRQQALENQVRYLKDITEGGKKVMINTGNDYAVAYSSIVTNMNLYGSAYTLLDEQVPVYQMAIHGLVDYTGEALNLTQNQEQELLISAEYGAGLAFTLMDESAFTLQKTLYTQYFGAEFSAWHDRLLEVYRRYDSELGHVFNQQMVGHDNITATLSCTEYADGTKVYVNYGYDAVKTPEGKDLPARDYLVIR